MDIGLGVGSFYLQISQYCHISIRCESLYIILGAIITNNKISYQNFKSVDQETRNI